LQQRRRQPLDGGGFPADPGQGEEKFPNLPQNSLVVGMVVYFLYGYRHSRLRHAEAPGGAPLPPDFNPEQQLPESDVHEHK
jgi:hypothetical protein